MYKWFTQEVLPREAGKGVGEEVRKRQEAMHSCNFREYSLEGTFNLIPQNLCNASYTLEFSPAARGQNFILMNLTVPIQANAGDSGGRYKPHTCLALCGYRKSMCSSQRVVLRRRVTQVWAVGDKKHRQGRKRYMRGPEGIWMKHWGWPLDSASDILEPEKSYKYEILNNYLINRQWLRTVWPPRSCYFSLSRFLHQINKNT